MIPIISPRERGQGWMGGVGCRPTLEATACWSKEVWRTVAHDLITAYTQKCFCLRYRFLLEMHAQERLRAIIPHCSPSVLPWNRTPTGKKNTTPLLGLHYVFFFYIALIETSNLELILGGAPRRCNWYACKSMCCRTHCTAYYFISYRKRNKKIYVWKQRY